MTLKPAPINIVAMTGDIQCTLGLAVQPNQNRPIAKRTPPIIYKHISVIYARISWAEGLPLEEA